MKDLFIIWIIMQLILIGIGMASIHNQIVDKTLKCVKDEKISEWWTAFIPLVVFIPDTTELTDYCSKFKVEDKMCKLEE